jgi:Ca-activated chloride channel family protein
VDELPDGFQVGLIFSSASRILVAPTTERETVLAALETLQSRGGTAMGEAILDALNVAARRRPAMTAPATTSRATTITIATRRTRP